VLWAHIIPIGGILPAGRLCDCAQPSGRWQRRPRRRRGREADPAGRTGRGARCLDVASLKNGEQVFAAQCTACHTAGVAGAPKLGDAGAWGPRIATGYDALLHSALAGKGSMGPQGGGDFTDLEIGRAVVYMANKSGAKFEDPKTAPATTSTAKVNEGGDAAAAAAVAAAKTAMAGVKSTAAAAPAAAATGAAPPLFAQVCEACHAAGVAGAPKVGDKAAWAPRLAQGIDGMTATVIKGKGAMPPKGGSTASDGDIKAVVTYMANASK
jgi:cytochrome c5